MDTSLRYKNENQTGQFGNQRIVTIAGARETVGSQVVQQTGILCFNCKEFGHFAKECRKPKRANDYTYHKEKMLMCKQVEKGVLLQAKQANWLEDTDEEIDEQKLEVHYNFMAKIQERQHSEQPESINDIHVVEKDDSNVILDSSNMCDNDNQADQNANECDDEQECKSALKECKFSLEKSNRTRDRYLGALHDKEAELESELKKEMFADLEYVQSLEKEIDELESDKADFSNIYDLLLQECISKDVMCSYLHSLFDLDAYNELQCLYLHKVKECKCLAEKLSKQTEKVSKEAYNGLLRSFAKLKEHLISLEIALQQCQKQMKNDTVYKQNESTVFLKEREHYFEIQDLKAQLQDKTIAINLQGNDLLTSNRGYDLYTISLRETSSPTPICFLAKASPTQAWLSHRINFDTINLLSKKDIMNGLPKLKYAKDQVCSSYELSKAKRSTFKTNTVPTSKAQLNLLHMDLCGPMRIESINGKKYILTLHAYFKEEGIEHQTSTPRTPEQNGVVKRRNCTLVEAARTMLLASKLPLFFWAEATATACYTQNRCLIFPRHEKIAYHIINDRKPYIKHLHIFGCTCCITRDGENLDKMKEKRDSCILVGNSTQSKGYKVYNKRTRLIFESIHINFNEIKSHCSKEFFTANNHSVSTSSSLSDNSTKQNTQPTANIQPTTEPITPTTNVNATENNNNQAADAHIDENKYYNIFSTPVREEAESSSRNVNNSNMHTFYQRHQSEHRWTKDHPLEQVRGNPSKPVQTR
ncbi:retrovirus-related pol polyprotein from transposon TNT 1-94 [Tanacetum coccineum]